MGFFCSTFQCSTPTILSTQKVGNRREKAHNHVTLTHHLFSVVIAPPYTLSSSIDHHDAVLSVAHICLSFCAFKAYLEQDTYYFVKFGHWQEDFSATLNKSG